MVVKKKRTVEGKRTGPMIDSGLVFYDISCLDETHYLFTGKCDKYDFELSVRLKPFPDEKTRDRAYRVWAETYTGISHTCF